MNTAQMFFRPANPCSPLAASLAVITSANLLKGCITSNGFPARFVGGIRNPVSNYLANGQEEVARVAMTLRAPIRSLNYPDIPYVPTNRPVASK